jgi:hypothetical protein
MLTQEQIEHLRKFGTYELCTCGHFGGSTPKQNCHTGLIEEGHGSCIMEGCECGKFRWKSYADRLGNAIQEPVIDDEL